MNSTLSQTICHSSALINASYSNTFKGFICKHFSCKSKFAPNIILTCFFGFRFFTSYFFFFSLKFLNEFVSCAAKSAQLPHQSAAPGQHLGTAEKAHSAPPDDASDFVLYIIHHQSTLCNCQLFLAEIIAISCGHKLIRGAEENHGGRWECLGIFPIRQPRQNIGAISYARKALPVATFSLPYDLFALG